MDKLLKLFDTPHHRRTMANSMDDMYSNRSSVSKLKHRKTQSKKNKTKGGKSKTKYLPNTRKKNKSKKNK